MKPHYSHWSRKTLLDEAAGANCCDETVSKSLCREGVDSNFMMSAKDDKMMCCTCCGTAEVDEIQLKTCPACKSVRYCSHTCQENHRPEHEEACKKRAAELRDEILFKEPESSFMGDCPICCLPLYPLDPNECCYHPCCSKFVCMGCEYANFKREKKERLEHSCPFCRDVSLTGDDNQKLMKRVQANDPSALCCMGTKFKEEGKYIEACQYWSKAAKLGDMKAHYLLSFMYFRGQGVEKDMKKHVYHLEEAAIGGHPGARHFLGAYERGEGRNDRAVKHMIIASNLGHCRSMETLKMGYKNGFVSKEDFAAALRAHNAAVAATKSPQRDVVDKAYEKRRCMHCSGSGENLED